MIREFTKQFYMSAGECNAQGEMPVTLLVHRIIEVATLHANSWGVGYDRLIADNHTWVLTRVTTQMRRYPRAGEDYSLTTWIEDYNRHFSQRNIEIASASGEVLGYARTIWMVIDLAARTAVDISQLSYIRSNVSPKACPIEPQSHLRPVATPTRSVEHRFSYTDIDFNRHVNTLRYIGLLLDQMDMRWHDEHMLERMEIAFVKEVQYGSSACLAIDDAVPGLTLFSIDVDNINRLRARFHWQPR